MKSSTTNTSATRQSMASNSQDPSRYYGSNSFSTLTAAQRLSFAPPPHHGKCFRFKSCLTKILKSQILRSILFVVVFLVLMGGIFVVVETRTRGAVDLAASRAETDRVGGRSLVGFPDKEMGNDSDNEFSHDENEDGYSFEEEATVKMDELEELPIWNMQSHISRNDKIRGVSLGGWLALEPFITPSLFEGIEATDEWSLCEKLGKEACAETMRHHYDTFITERDIAQIKLYGFNFVRIPVAYWIFDVDESSEPFPPTLGLDYLKRAIEWCRKYRLYVALDLHCAPGQQNPFNHSGKLSAFGWKDKGIETFLPRMRLVFEAMGAALSSFKNVAIIGIVNEPSMIYMDADATEFLKTKLYPEIYSIIRSQWHPDVVVAISDGFLGGEAWAGFKINSNCSDIVLDLHQYLIFDDQLLNNATAQTQLEVPGNIWKSQIEKTGMPTLTGEWSLAHTDCAKYLLGIHSKPRYNRPCKFDYKHPTYRSYLKKFGQEQISAFESAGSVGSFFWTWKLGSTAEEESSRHWDASWLIQEGLLKAPKNW